MSHDATWLVLSFAIMVVAVLVNLYEKGEGLQKRLERLEARESGPAGIVTAAPDA